MSLGLNRSLVSLDNKLNQFDAAVTVQRGVRQALTEIDKDLRTRLVLADQFKLTSPTQWYVHLRPGIRYSDGSPVAVEDVATALKMYSEVDGSFVAAFFPEFPTVEKIDETSFTLNTERPVPVLDYLMSNILITPGGQECPGGTAVRRRNRPLRRHRKQSRRGHLHPGAQRQVLGHAATRRIGSGAVHARRDQPRRLVAQR